MKRVFLLLGILFFSVLPIFSQNERIAPDDGDDDVEQVQDFKYTINGKGDQFIKIAVMGNFPLNFDDKLYVGGAAELGYFRFLNSWLAFGGELMVGYNPTLGSNSLTFVPITIGVLFQPSVWKFEFPIIQSIGMAFETCQNKKYFPGFATKTEVGVFFRINDSWSLGAGTDFLYLPQWHNTDNNVADYGLFMTALVAARYHF